jgi:fructose-1,6-bisphosphatase I
MTTLREYLDTTKCDKGLKDLIELIANQGDPIRKAFITNQKYVDTKNIYGETQIELDKWSNDHLKKVLGASKLVKELASEEEDEIVKFSDATGNFAVTMDPLDGSSLVQVNLAVGTIIGIFDNGKVMQEGKNLRAAMYILYGPLTLLTLTVKEGVHIFALDGKGVYNMMQKDVKIPEGNLYASGALRKDWFPKQKAFIEGLEAKGYKLRYSGSFVADCHQMLKYGGIFCYPIFAGHEKGKLRLLFEANPLTFIITQAGGRGSTGAKDILTIMPEKVDHRLPIYIGTKSVVEAAEKALA